MLVGDDFKKDTSARGVLVVTVVNATEFKEGDRGLGPLKKGSSEYFQAFLLESQICRFTRSKRMAPPTRAVWTTDKPLRTT